VVINKSLTANNPMQPKLTLDMSSIACGVYVFELGAGEFPMAQKKVKNSNTLESIFASNSTNFGISL
jgi:hypothetical protein